MLTDDTITAAMERAATQLRAGGLGHRLTLMPSPADHVRTTVDADGWAEIGVVADPDHRHDWRVWRT